jgi:UDP-glucose 6-dehydrogenase
VPRQLAVWPETRARDARQPERLSMNIAVVGIGYVGLVSGACFAELGHTVIGVDNDISKIRALREGCIPVCERHLPELLQKHLGRRLDFTASLAQAVHASEVNFVAVGAPPSISGDPALRGVRTLPVKWQLTSHLRNWLS